MDEMDEYRERIERRYGDRRRFKKRRKAIASETDWLSVGYLLALILVGFVMFFKI